MKKIISIVISIIMVMLLTACSDKEDNKQVKKPEIMQIRSICDLATMECYYHNVAKSKKTAGEGILHIGEKEREFWIEYTGIAKVGIDMSKVDMKIDGEKVKVFIPKAKILSTKIDDKSFNKDSFIMSSDGLNKNKITADDQTKAIKNAQKKMEESVNKNSALLLEAQERAKKLIGNYIKQIGKFSNINYKVEWEYEKGSVESIGK